MIRNFVHRLIDRDRVDAVLRRELFRVDRHRLVAVALAINPGRDQIAHATAAQEVTDANISPPVPGKEHRAASRLAIVLGQIDPLIADLVQLALHHPVGPENDEPGRPAPRAPSPSTNGATDWPRPDSGVVWSYGTKSPCPSRVTRVPIPCELVRISSGFTRQYPPSRIASQCWPFPEFRATAGPPSLPIKSRSGSASPIKIDGRQPLRRPGLQLATGSV